MVTQSLRSFAGRALLGSVLSAAVSLSAFAGSADYRFEATRPEVEPGKQAITVRLIHTPSGKAVTGAELSLPTPQLDMAMPPLGPMTAWVSAVREQAPGSYRLQADLSMAGEWLLTLNAKVPGEQEPIRGSIPITVVPTRFDTWTTQAGE